MEICVGEWKDKPVCLKNAGLPKSVSVAVGLETLVLGTVGVSVRERRITTMSPQIARARVELDTYFLSTPK